MTVVVCAVVFFVFSFSWLYWFQGDMLAVAQHVLSGGQTHYEKTVGAVLITVILMIIQHVVYSFIRLSRRTHALTYFPSFLILTMLSCLGPGVSRNLSFGAWVWAAPLLLLLWGGGAWMSKQMPSFDSDDKRPFAVFSRRLWVNMLLMVMMMLMVAVVGETKAVDHYRAHAETSLMDNDVDEALRVGRRSLETDVNLTMVRLYALSRKGLVGDSLFTYPVVGSSADMLPLTGSHSRLLIYPADSMWQHFGERIPHRTMTVKAYLDSLAIDTTATRAYVDYRLAGMLIDRQLDSFVQTLPQYYQLVPDSLPRHYREALVLYGNSIVDSLSQPFTYSDSLTTEKWQAMKTLEGECATINERRQKMGEQFRTTYWYYFFYSK